MRQRNQIELPPRISHPKLVTDYRIQLLQRHELFNRQFAHRNHQFRLEDLHFPLQPRRTIRNFIRARHAIAARGLLPRKTTAHRRHVNRSAKRFLVHPCRFVKPSKQRLPRRPCERPSHHRFLVTWRLPHQHHLAHHRPAAHHRLMHLRTKPARTQPLHMLDQQSFRLTLFCNGLHPPNKK